MKRFKASPEGEAVREALPQPPLPGNDGTPAPHPALRGHLQPPR